MAFGGAIKLTGESEYKRALNSITQSLRETSARMKEVTSVYDKNDKSTSAINAKTQILSKTLELQTAKLNTLKSQYASMSAEMQTQAANHTRLLTSYTNEKAKLDEIGRTLGTASSEYQKQKAVVDELAAEVNKSTKAQDANEKSMSDMRVSISNAQTDCNKTAKSLDELGREAKESGDDAKKGSEGYTVFKNVLANLASDAVRKGLSDISSGIKSVASGLVRVGKEAIASYGEYEQLVGGIDTFFGESSKKVQEYAESAYKTAGISANQYMEQATSFSATLLQGLGGDTSKAADYADKAIKDMADNANRMGTDMTMIQNAYQGFAKDNYTMLDNLKLGYGGTAGEMARLITDSGVLDKNVKITAKNVKDVPFDKVIEALHITQQRLGITGTTAKEAAGTLQGSSMAMKAAWQNLLTGIADDNADFNTLVQNFIDSLLGAAENFLPRIQTVLNGLSALIVALTNQLLPQVVQLGTDTINGLVSELNDNLPEVLESAKTIITSLLQELATVLPQLAPLALQIIMALVQTLLQNLPQIVKTGMDILVSLIRGLTDTLPQLISMLPEIIKDVSQTLVNNLPLIVEAGEELLVALINGLSDAIPLLIDYIPQIVETVVNVVMNNLPMITEVAVQIIFALINGMIKTLPSLISRVPQIITTIVKTLVASLPDIIRTGGKLISSLIQGIGSMIGTLAGKAGQIVTTIINKIKELPKKVGIYGTNLVKGIWNGIKDATSWILNKIKGFGKSVLNGIKSVFGIHSPSRVMRDQVGKYLARGIGEGFTSEMAEVTKDMYHAIPSEYDINTNVNSKAATIPDGYAYTDMLSAFKAALSEMKIELDDEVAGRFVEKTVTRAIYA